MAKRRNSEAMALAKKIESWFQEARPVSAMPEVRMRARSIVHKYGSDQEVLQWGGGPEWEPYGRVKDEMWVGCDK